MLSQNLVHDTVVLGGVARPMHVDAVRSCICLKLIEVFVKMRERMLLDRRRQRAKFFPFRDDMHFRIALLAQVPEPFVMHLFVFRGGNEPCRGFHLIDRAVAMDLRATRLRFGRHTQRFRAPLGMIEPVTVSVDRVGIVVRQEFGMQDGIVAHAAAAFRICAMWMNLSGTPIRSAQPFWCIRQELSADTMYSAPARAWSATLS